MLGFMLSLFLISDTSFLGLPAFDPRVEWLTLETRHFYIHYERSIDPIAQRVAGLFEEAHTVLTPRFKWEPSSKVHVVLNDSSDESNGLSTPLPYNAVYLYIAPPGDTSSLDTYDDWLRTLIFHEYTHTLHLDQAYGINRFLRALFGKTVVPNAAQQQWGHEGLAILHETTETTKGRGRSPYVDMVLRTAILEKKFLPIDRATYWHDRHPFGNAAYFYGIKFYQFLIERYGSDAIYEFTRETASWPIPSFMNFKTKRIFGKSFHRLWNEWQSELESRYKTFSPKPLSREWLKPEERLEGFGTWSEDGQIFYAPVASLAEGRQIVAFDFSKGLSSPTRQIIKERLAPSHLQYWKGKLYYAKLSSIDRYRNFSDIYEWDLAKNKERPLTRGLRLRDPLVTDVGILAIRTDKLESEIVRLHNRQESLISTDDLEVIYKAPPHSAVSHLSWQNNQLAFSLRDHEARSIHVVNYEPPKAPSKGRRSLKPNTASKRIDGLNDCYHPSFVSSTTIVAACYDTSSLPELNEAVSKIVVLDLQNGHRRIISESVTGEFYPVVGSRYKAWARFTSDGYKLEIDDVKPAEARSSLDSKRFWLRDYKIGFKESEFESTIHGATAKATPSSSAIIEKTEYDSKTSLLPHFLFPFFFYTENDLAVGLQSSSQDPLAFWNWGANVYYLSAPQRPGGSLSVSYRGLHPVRLFAVFASTISDLGTILALRTTDGLQLNRYYEHTYFVSSGFGWTPYGEKGPWPLSVSASAYFEKRGSLFQLPANAVSGVIEELEITRSGIATAYTNTLGSPERGYQWGLSLNLSSSPRTVQAPDDISPAHGFLWGLTVDYSPTIPKNNLDSLTTTASLRFYREVVRDHFIALKVAGGAQWFEPHYQRSFRLGGAFGQSPFTSVNKQIYALRGLEAGLLRGEAVAQGQFEYRAALLKSLPGFGTAPLWIKDLSLALFTDIGQTFQVSDDPITLYEAISNRVPQTFALCRWTHSVGGELRAPISLIYGPPLVFRAGYGHVLYKEGTWVADQKVNQVYMSFGSSF